MTNIKGLPSSDATLLRITWYMRRANAMQPTSQSAALPHCGSRAGLGVAYTRSRTFYAHQQIR